MYLYMQLSGQKNPGNAIVTFARAFSFAAVQQDGGTCLISRRAARFSDSFAHLPGFAHSVEHGDAVLAKQLAFDQIGLPSTFWPSAVPPSITLSARY
jgi:hypothetical protein